MSSLSNPFRTSGRGLLALAVGVALIFPQSATASTGGDAIWKECLDTGSVSSSHSQQDFSDAIGDPPQADAAEYSPCLDVIRLAQNRTASSAGGPVGSASGGGGSSAGGAGSAAPAVTPQDLSAALAEQGVSAAAPAGTPSAAPGPSVIAGEKIDLSADRLPSIANALSLPLPLAASAVVVLFSAALPAIRFAVGRFGAPPTGTTPNL